MVTDNKFIRIFLAVTVLLLLVISLAFVIPRVTKNDPETIPVNKNVQNQNNTSEVPPRQTTIYGRVGKIEKDFFQLLQDDALTQKHTVYKVKVTSETTFLKKQIVIPYLLTPTPTESQLKAVYLELEEGMPVEIVTSSNLGNKNKEIVAQTIVLPRIPYVLQGTVKSIQSNKLIVDAAPVLETLLISDSIPSLPKHKIYTINISENTEISAQEESGQKKYKLQDLYQGQMVVIYAESDVTKSLEVTAARVEPVL